jgi:hypothetical protein
MTRSARIDRDPVPAQLRLFAPEDLAARPTPEARLKRLARRPTRPPTRREAREEEDRRAMDRLRQWGRDLASHFGLRWTAIDPERDGVTTHYGICYADGVIRIRLRHAKTGRLLKESSLVDTLCHELGHLKHFDHSPRFWRYYRRILDEARKRGYYRPGPGPTRARQRGLFELVDGPCGNAGASGPETTR